MVAAADASLTPVEKADDSLGCECSDGVRTSASLDGGWTCMHDSGPTMLCPVAG